MRQVWRFAQWWKKKKKGGPWSQGVCLFWEWPLGLVVHINKKLRGFSFYNGTNGGSSSTKWSFKIFSTYLWNGKGAITTGYYSSWYRIFSNNLVWTNLPNTNKMCRSPNHRAFLFPFFFTLFSLFLPLKKEWCSSHYPLDTIELSKTYSLHIA